MRISECGMMMKNVVLVISLIGNPQSSIGNRMVLVNFSSVQTRTKNLTIGDATP